LFLPHYFRGEYYTAYQLMERRFGAKVKAAAACTFLVTRVHSPKACVSRPSRWWSRPRFGTGQRTSILLIMALVLVYTFEGGMKAVIWTDVIQFILYFSGSLAAFFLLLHIEFREDGKLLRKPPPPRTNFASSIFRSALQIRQRRLHVLVRRNRRHFFHDGQPRIGSDHRAAPSRRQVRTREQVRASRQRRHYSAASLPCFWFWE
jgi:hypothetical protein